MQKNEGSLGGEGGARTLHALSAPHEHWDFLDVGKVWDVKSHVGIKQSLSSSPSLSFPACATSRSYLTSLNVSFLVAKWK